MRFYYYILKCFLCIIVFLILGILCKRSSIYRNRIHYQLYEKSFSFARVNDWCNRYLGGINPFLNVDSKDRSVFHEEIKALSLEKYLDGVRLYVGDYYYVPSQSDGVVVYIGEKDGYGNVVMVEGGDDVITWYGNVCHSSLKLYDYVSLGDGIGESCDEYLYLVYSKNNQFLNYEDYLSYVISS